jgi:hypothetical protein
MSNSQPSFPVTQAIGAQNSVIGVVIGYLDAQGNFQAVNSTTGLPTTGGGGGGGSFPATTNVSSTAYEKSHVIKASAGRLYSLSGYNSGVAQFYQLHDSGTLPADNAVPVFIMSVPAASNFSIDYGDVGRAFTNGIVICNSSTGPTKTLGATADSWFDAQIV